VCTSKDTLKNELLYLPEAVKEKAQFDAVANPVFERISNAWLCALIMAILGCDVYIPGMKAVRGKSAMRIVLSEDRTCEDRLFASLEKQFMERNNLSKEEVHTYVDAIMYKPTNHMPDVVNLVTEGSSFMARLYLFDCSSSLPRYIEQYSIDESLKLDNIFAGPPITLICKVIVQHKKKYIYVA
jgi:hypothetical protein